MHNSDKTFLSEEFCQKYPLLLAHLNEVLDKTKTTNLTGIRNRETGKVFHIADSLAVLAEINEAPQGELADLGSGAGYPGIPLAVVSGRRTTLIEANKKKADFLEGFALSHHLEGQISVVPERSELLDKRYFERFAVVTTRAVSSLPTILELAAPLLATGGHFVALKGDLDEEELMKGNKASEILGMELLAIRHYEIADTGHKRCVLTYVRSSAPKIDVPRRPGMAAKRPLA